MKVERDHLEIEKERLTVEKSRLTTEKKIADLLERLVSMTTSSLCWEQEVETRYESDDPSITDMTEEPPSLFLPRYTILNK